MDPFFVFLGFIVATYYHSMVYGAGLLPDAFLKSHWSDSVGVLDVLAGLGLDLGEDLILTEQGKARENEKRENTSSVFSLLRASGVRRFWTKF